MAVYLFTIHAYGSWLPDRGRGYVRRGEGVLPTDEQMAGWYRRDMSDDVVQFDRAAQRVIVDAVCRHCDALDYELYAVVTDQTHVHVLVGCKTYKAWGAVQRGLKSAISRGLNAELQPQQCLSRGANCKRIVDKSHFDHLMTHYLPSHRGVSYFANI